MALGHEGDVHAALLDQGPARCRGAFDDLYRHAVKILAELLEQVREQDEGEADTDSELAMLAALQGADALHGALQMIEAEGRLFEEALAGGRWPDTGMITLEELGPETMLEGAYTSADRRMLHVQRGSRAPETPILGRGKDISEQTKIDNAAGHLASS